MSEGRDPRILLDREVRVERLVTVSSSEAKALEDPTRMAILEMLSRKPMSVEDLWEELRAAGYGKSINTVRHHLNVLVSSGLVELVRVVETRGAHLKYYASKAKPIAHEGPMDVRRLREAVEYATGHLERLVSELVSRYGREIEDEAKKLRPCPYCDLNHFKDYVVASIIESALARIMTARKAGAPD